MNPHAAAPDPHGAARAAAHPPCIVLIDDHPLFRSGMRLLLHTLNPGVEVLEAPDIDTLHVSADEAPGACMCLLDLDLRAIKGLDTLERARVALPGMPLVVLSAHEESAVIRACLDRGASGYVPKSATPETLLEALRRILQGQVYLPDTLQDAPMGGGPAVPLSQRQQQVLAGLARGLPTKSIAAGLHLSEYTVKEHLAEVYRALGVHSRTEAVIKASRMTIRVHPWPP